MRFIPHATGIASLMLLAVLPGCAVTREQQLRAKSDRVESHLKVEQRRVLGLGGEDFSRQPRLDHLNELHTALSAANIGLGVVSRAVPPEQRDTWYDVIDEAYDTIDWNIPLGPADPKRPMPAKFSGGMLNLN